ncbi:MAG: hypothetical protein FWD15_03510 [Alphaproteobacteria bacterium]|nr:hypothetical protein [Alphaproteobacteria bacterium]
MQKRFEICVGGRIDVGSDKFPHKEICYVEPALSIACEECGICPCGDSNGETMPDFATKYCKVRQNFLAAVPDVPVMPKTREDHVIMEGYNVKNGDGLMHTAGVRVNYGLVIGMTELNRCFADAGLRLARAIERARAEAVRAS